MEPQQNQNSRDGIIAILTVVLAVPLYLAGLCGAWALVPIAWRLLLSQFAG